MMNIRNRINEECLVSSAGERLQNQPADGYNAEQFYYNQDMNNLAVTSKLQVRMKILLFVFWIGLAVITFITLPFYYALGALYVVPLVIVALWAVWQMVRGEA